MNDNFANFSIPVIIRNLCQNWKISDDENYALKFYEKTNKNYVTEKNRHEVKNGLVLRLFFSPTKTADDILNTLKNGTNIDKEVHLERLSDLSSDLTFALEFIKKQGMNIVISMIENEKCIGEMLKFLMLSFVELMEHGTISWDVLQSEFINRNISFIIQPSKVPNVVVQCALSNLENVIRNSVNYTNVIENDVTLDSLLFLLQDSASDSHIVKQNVIALINALFDKASDSRKQYIKTVLCSKRFRDAFVNSADSSHFGISHQLYVLQTLTLGLLAARMIEPTNAQDQYANDQILELRRIAFDDGLFNDSHTDVSTLRHNSITGAGNYKKLGFKCDLNPTQDFLETPPGLLALHCMLYFARNYTSQYTKVVHENCRADEHECPFGRTSIELTKVMCDILRIGEAPTEQGQEYHAMFFTHDHPFEELFCICIVVLNRTWKDMRATSEDFAKVFSVVREQIQRSMKARPSSLDDFKSKIQTLNYATITTLRQQERTSREECESTASAIVSLKEKITPEIISLIKMQRLGCLVEGTRFAKFSRGSRIKEKFWYAKLSPNHKVLHYGDCDEKTTPTLEELGNKIQVYDIKQLLVGPECPHMKERKKPDPNLGFSITYYDTGHRNLGNL